MYKLPRICSLSLSAASSAWLKYFSQSVSNHRLTGSISQSIDRLKSLSQTADLLKWRVDFTTDCLKWFLCF